MRPVINPVYPIAAINTVDELMCIAVGMEAEAARRYEQLAALMESKGEPDLAATFRELAEMERDHEAGIGRWAAREGRTAPEPASFSWQLPETFEEAPESLTPYAALGIAVRNEERAFTFYSYLSALAPDAQTQARAESLAREELKHVRQLKGLRRRAFHRARPPADAPRPARTLEEMRRMVAGLENGSQVVDELVVAALGACGQEADATVLRKAMPMPAGEVGGGASLTVRAAHAAGLLVPGALPIGGTLRLALRDAEEVAELALGTAENATDEELLHQAQHWAERAVGRLALLRTLTKDVEGGGQLAAM